MSFFKPKPAKSTSSSLSENTNNAALTAAYNPQISEGTTAGNFLSQLLGETPDTGAQAGYNNYLQNAGYAPAMQQLFRNTTAGQAASGMLNSGATAKALQSRGADLNQQYFNNYLQQLSGQAGLGLQAGGLVANTGQKSTSTGMSIGGQPSAFDSISSGIGKVASVAGKVASIFSDRRLKADIVKEGEFGDGLGVYSFRYVTDPARHVGVMADEVEKLRPWALGPDKVGFSTVDYARL